MGHVYPLSVNRGNKKVLKTTSGILTIAKFHIINAGDRYYHVFNFFCV